MIDDEFEWDDVKAARNFRDHGIAFDMAREVFRDPFALDWIDTRDDYGEHRYATVGVVQGRLLYVADEGRADTHYLGPRSRTP